MSKVTGIGGVFVTSKDPEALRRWYGEMLGIDVSQWGAMFQGSAGDMTVWNAFKTDAKKFAPTGREFMVNLRVDDADGLVAAMKAKGATVLEERREAGEYGIFCYAVDPDGTVLELWQPPNE